MLDAHTEIVIILQKIVLPAKRPYGLKLVIDDFAAFLPKNLSVNTLTVILVQMQNPDIEQVSNSNDTVPNVLLYTNICKCAIMHKRILADVYPGMLATAIIQKWQNLDIKVA